MVEPLHNILTSDVTYTEEEAEFLKAMEAYGRTNGRRFPTYREVLAVARSLGYRKVAEPEPAPVYRVGPSGAKNDAKT